MTISPDHFVQDYRKHVDALKANFPNDEAMKRAVGTDFEATGQLQVDALRMFGLKDGMRIIDLGCGSGRTGSAIARNFDVEYHGIDVVPDLIQFAKTITPPRYRYTVVSKVDIPDEAESADMLCAFSLFTHLLHEDTYVYLEEAVRVLRPGGVIVFSFLEFANPRHWALFEPTKNRVRQQVRPHLNVFIEREAINCWAQHLGLSVERYISSLDGPVVPISTPAKRDNGTVFEGMGQVGQTYVALRRS